mmetsp:Transcript_20672/g.58160  ORF Transcript_20672/g.58160 Transcript_20672/m.58160 type:complete len:276 (+) Transcript_20672:26-853(+)
MAKRVFVFSVLEIMIIDMQVDVVTHMLLECALEKDASGQISIPRLQAAALLLSSLPEAYHTVLYKEFIRSFENTTSAEASTLPGSPSSPANLGAGMRSSAVTYDLELALQLGASTRLDAVLLVLELFFHYTSADRLKFVQVILRKIVDEQSVLTISQVLLVCKLVSPFTDKIVSSLSDFSTIIVRILQCLQRVETLYWDQFETLQELNALDPTEPVCRSGNRDIPVLSTIINFLYYCFSKVEFEPAQLLLIRKHIQDLPSCLVNVLHHVYQNSRE